MLLVPVMTCGGGVELLPAVAIFVSSKVGVRSVSF